MKFPNTRFFNLLRFLSLTVAIHSNCAATAIWSQDTATSVPSIESTLERQGEQPLATVVFGSIDTKQQRWANSNPESVQAKIVDFNTTSILLQFPSDPAIKTRPSADVIDISFAWASQDAVDAETAFEKQNYAEVIRLGKATISAAKMPNWQQRFLVSRMVEALSNSDQKVIAGKLFLSLLKDSAPPLVYRSAPLLWQNIKVNTNMISMAETWIQDANSVDAQLLGASWLLSTPKSEAAKEILQRLTVDRNATVARLATSQIWRAATPKEVASDYQGWQDIRDQFPVWLQSGPSFVIADKLERASLISEALQEYVRIISLHKPYDALTQESILRASEILKKQNRSEEAEALVKKSN